MRTYTVTFTFPHITCPDTDEPLEGHEAFAQWLREFNFAAGEWENLVAFKVIDRSEVTAATVRLVTDVEYDEATLCDAVQECLYDKGGLSGNFRAGRCRNYDVTILVPRVVTVFAASLPEAYQHALMDNPGSQHPSPL